MESKLKYIIVQAGGKGTRLERLTRNKPKALVSINNLPMLFHLFRKFPKAKFLIIADYKSDVMKRYLKAFADVEYEIITMKDIPGTCAGLKESLDYIPNDTPFMISWCDVILPQSFDVSKLNFKDKNYVGLSQDFECRWKYQDNKFEEIKSLDYGVAGVFLFTNKNVIANVPNEGEFVKWLSTQNINFDTFGLKGGKEYGLIKVVDAIEQPKCRPFNKLTHCIVKEGIDEQGQKLAKREREWYKVVANQNFESLPKIYNYEPLIMEYVDGGPIYTYQDSLNEEEKKKIIDKIVNCLKQLHTLGEIPADRDSYDDNYINKTLDRLEKVRDLAPFANDEYIIINDKKCKNVFYCIDEIKKQMDKYFPKNFKFIHGDCTFSNILLNSNKEPILIDPRGYFGKIELYGDVAYDWAKLYYSLFTNYDQFNLKNFELFIDEENKKVNIQIPNNNWENLKEYFLELIKDEVSEEQLNLILALIWLSLTTYAWDNYDSVCGAFYEGLLLLNECKFMEDIKND